MVDRLYKIAVVVPRFGPVGGAEHFVFQLTRRLARDSRFEFHILAHQWDASLEKMIFHRMRKIRFPRLLSSLSFAHCVNRCIQNHDFDLVHTHERIFAADLFTMHSIPHKTWVRDVRKKPMSFHDLALCYLEKRLTARGGLSRILAVSSLARDHFLKVFPDKSPLTRVVNPGIDTRRFDLWDREVCRHEVRTRFGLDQDKPVVLFVGLNFHIKGLDTLMAAMAGVRENNPERGIQLLVVGKGNIRKYRNMAENLGISDHVRFAGIVKAQIEKVYLAADVFAMLSRFDTFGLVVLEAMAASLPVIISQTVGASDVVMEGQNGFIVDGTDASAVSKRLEALSNSNVRRNMAARARKTALACSWDRVAEETLRAYEAVL